MKETQKSRLISRMFFAGRQFIRLHRSRRKRKPPFRNGSGAFFVMPSRQTVRPAFLPGFFSPKFRRKLPTFAFAPIRLPAVVRFPEEQAVDDATRPCSHAVLFPPPCARGQRFIRKTSENRIDDLVNSNEHRLEVRHRFIPCGMTYSGTIASTSSAVVAASSKSSYRCL